MIQHAQEVALGFARCLLADLGVIRSMLTPDQGIVPFDPDAFKAGETRTSDKYPRSASALWWQDDGMDDYCQTRPVPDRAHQRPDSRPIPHGYGECRLHTVAIRA